MTNTPTTLRELAQCYAALPHDKKSRLFDLIMHEINAEIDRASDYSVTLEDLDVGEITDCVQHAIEHCADGLVEGSV